MMILKIDFAKAYDSVSWEYFDRVMQFMNIGTRRRAWIQECLILDGASVLFNGSHTCEFQLQRGLRQ